MSDQNRLVFSSSSLSVGSKQHPSLTFDLRGTTVQKRNRLYCSAICGNKGSTLTLKIVSFKMEIKWNTGWYMENMVLLP